MRWLDWLSFGYYRRARARRMREDAAFGAMVAEGFRRFEEEFDKMISRMKSTVHNRKMCVNHLGKIKKEPIRKIMPNGDMVITGKTNGEK